jgi:hypothetical protein
MTDAILLAYKDVERSMEQFTQLLQSHVDTMRAAPSYDSDKVFRLSQGSKAMRDSAMIYLSYAKYVAYGMPESEDMVQDDTSQTMKHHGPIRRTGWARGVSTSTNMLDTAHEMRHIVLIDNSTHD